MIPFFTNRSFFIKRILLNIFPILLLLQVAQVSVAQHSVAREWNEVLLHAIRNDLARPTVHARNLFHTSVAMYDAWAVYDTIAEPFLLGKTVNGFTCDFDGVSFPADIEAARKEAISYAAYRVLRHRFQFSPGGFFILQKFDSLMNDLNYNTNFTSTDYTTGSPAALGNYIAECIISFGLQDGSNESTGYNNQAYEPVNEPLVMAFPGNPNLDDPNRWQPLTLDLFIDQSGNPIPFNTPKFLSPEWGQVTPFALSQDDVSIYQRDGFDYLVYHDPGPPPYLDTTTVGGTSEEYKWGFSLVSIWSSHLDPTDSVMIDISPASFGNIPDSLYPTNVPDLRNFYNYIEGGDPSSGHTVNPSTGQPYTPQMVPRADYARVLAEFWADGPDSETPPGHWFTLLNYVSDHPDLIKKYRGQGDILDDLEWDIKSYMMMGGAMHDAAITAWGIKGWYDYIRPVSAIRRLADYGQSSDSNLPNYHPGGILLEPGYIELVDSTDILVGDSLQHLNKIKVKAWRGPDSIPDVDTTYAGVDWILAENWFPYQRPTFVTPNFAGYISGHSTYSRAAADILTKLTGDPFFPGGMGEFEAPMNEFLVFEDGPSVDLTLQWATYRDASDQTSLSRIWGGIHPPADDIPGRLIGVKIANDAFALAEELFFVDQDNDGFYNYEDCNDLDSLVNPNIAETCDGIDNNCDNQVDENFALNTYYYDGDNDSFGTPDSIMEICFLVPPVGFVTNAMDCNDMDSLIHPNAIEACDSIDNNCSGFIDDGIPYFTFYVDSDGDGFGTSDLAIDSISRCIDTIPMGYSDNNWDCNDLDSLINPSASEVCDSIDNNCSGFIDDGIPYFTFYLDSDGDGFGTSDFTIDSIARCIDTIPMGYSDNNWDCNDLDSLINPSASEVCDSIDNNCSGFVDDGIAYYSFYLDGDSDGFGAKNDSLYICNDSIPMGYVDNNLDCDDSDAAVNPDSDEVCDDIDNNCSGIIDDGLPMFQYYLDADGDTFGNIDSTLQSCYFSTPDGYAMNNDDCDDTNPEINPDGVEIFDNLDNDCDGEVDNVVSTEDLENSFSLKISPNPVSEILTLQYEYTGSVLVKILNVDGKILIENAQISGQSIDMDVQSLAPAMYFLVIQNEEMTRQAVKQFVKY